MKTNRLKSDAIFLTIFIFFISCGTNEKYSENKCPDLINNKLMDIDGNEYNIVTIGAQLWMAENLKTTKYSNGDSVENITNGSQWGNLNYGAYCIYDNDISNVETYGFLYNRFVVIDDRNICPCGWHVPTISDWDTLFRYLGGEEIAWNKMQESGKVHWLYCNTSDSEFQCGCNSSGFTALPAGRRISVWYHPPGEPLEYSVDYQSINHCSFFWIGSKADEQIPYSLISGSYSEINKGNGYDYTDGCSVRCIKD
jgi:uncharacterized protein (TIGR02145 family)